MDRQLNETPMPSQTSEIFYEETCLDPQELLENFIRPLVETIQSFTYEIKKFEYNISKKLK
jgi:hypothetical protein